MEKEKIVSPNKEKVQLTFGNMTQSAKSIILEKSTHTKELREIGEEYGLTLPSPDIAIVKTLFAECDQVNLNKCTLPLLEVQKSLPTLKGKGMDINHNSRYTIGYWLGCSLEETTLVAYGVFWKHFYSNEYDSFKESISSGFSVGVSMEAWGVRQFNPDGTYSLTDIHFSGGALLQGEQPACAGARVLEISTGPANTHKHINTTSSKQHFIDQVIEVAEVVKEGSEIQHYSVNYNEQLITINVKSSTGLEETFEISYGKCSDTKNASAISKELLNVTTIIGEDIMSKEIQDAASVGIKLGEATKMNEELSSKLKDATEELAICNTKLKELSEVYSTLEKSNTELQETIEKRDKEETAKVIASRREELGDAGKAYDDDYLANDDKFHIAKLTIQLESYNKGKPQTHDKMSVKEVATSLVDTDSRKKITDLAFGNDV